MRSSIHKTETYLDKADGSYEYLNSLAIYEAEMDEIDHLGDAPAEEGFISNIWEKIKSAFRWLFGKSKKATEDIKVPSTEPAAKGIKAMKAKDIVATYSQYNGIISKVSDKILILPFYDALAPVLARHEKLIFQNEFKESVYESTTLLEQIGTIRTTDDIKKLAQGKKIAREWVIPEQMQSVMEDWIRLDLDVNKLTGKIRFGKKAWEKHTALCFKDGKFDAKTAATNIEHYEARALTSAKAIPVFMSKAKVELLKVVKENENYLMETIFPLIEKAWTEKKITEQENKVLIDLANRSRRNLTQYFASVYSLLTFCKFIVQQLNRSVKVYEKTLKSISDGGEADA